MRQLDIITTKEKVKDQIHKKLPSKWIYLGVFIVGAVLLLAILGFLGILYAQHYEIDKSKLIMDSASTMYDREGQVVTKLYLQNREYVPLDEIPPMIRKSFMAIEDRRFYEHQGIDLRAIARALYRDILAQSKVEGGSTITQQLAKNVFLSHEKSWLRKTEEVLIALRLEKMYSKDDILEMYLNYIYFGHGAYGIEAASKAYFNKSLIELEIGEVALLAGLPKAPNHYSPIKERNKQRSEERRRAVLAVMEEQNIISTEEREAAEKVPLRLYPKDVTEEPFLRTYMDMVLQEAEDKYGLTSDELLTGGYQVYTALDSRAQVAMFEAFDMNSAASQHLFPPSGPERMVQGSMAIIDHRSGGIVAVMGGRDYVRKGLNRAVLEERQPGSVFKPIAVYAPALGVGWSPLDLVKDEPRSYGDYKPKNYDALYRGEVPMAEAVKWSYNAPAVWLLNEIGIEKGMHSAREFGFSHVERKLGIALGDVGASPLQMASAYGAFANNGEMMGSYLIEKILDRKGDTIVQAKQKGKKVVSSQVAWDLTKMLLEVVEKGTGKRARMIHPVAGKTGTTQSPKGQNGVRDAWFVGYTPTYSAAVWIGFDKVDSSHVMETSGGNHPARIFKYVMEKALGDKPIVSFLAPKGVKEWTAPQPPRKAKEYSKQEGNRASSRGLKDWLKNKKENKGKKGKKNNGKGR
jgi:penicillin-binding protein 2A